MNLIENNPYRVLGILVGTSLRDKTKTISRLKMLIEAEQKSADDFSFPHLGNINRTIDTVEKAASSLDLDIDKLRAAIFWFCNGSHTDEPAFDLLKESNTDGAIQIWTKLTRSGTVSKANSSAFLNLSTLNLWRAFNNGSIESHLFREGIALKLRLFESDHFNEIVKLSTDEKFKVSRNELEEIFLKDIYEEVIRLGNGYEPEFWNSLRDIDFSAKSLFEKNIIQVIVDKIEKHVHDSKYERKQDVTKSIEIGNKLIDNTKDELEKVKKILGVSNPKFTTLSDKISNEAAQCAIVYFNHFRETDFDPGEEAEALIVRAKNFAVGRLTIDKLNENGEAIEDWNNEKENRLRYKSVKSAIDEIHQILDEYQSVRHVSSNAVKLIADCRPFLAEMGNEIGFDDKLYIQISTTIAVAAQNYIIDEFNWLAEKMVKSSNSLFPEISYEQLKNALYVIHSAMLKVGILDMESEFEKKGYQKNKQEITNVCNTMRVNIKSSYGIKKISVTDKVKKTFEGGKKENNISQADIKWTIISIWILIILAILFLIYIRMGK